MNWALWGCHRDRNDLVLRPLLRTAIRERVKPDVVVRLGPARSRVLQAPSRLRVRTIAFDGPDRVRSRSL